MIEDDLHYFEIMCDESRIIMIIEFLLKFEGHYALWVSIEIGFLGVWDVQDIETIKDATEIFRASSLSIDII